MVSSHLFNNRGQANPNPRGSVWKQTDVVKIAFQTFHNFFNFSNLTLYFDPFPPRIQYKQVSFPCILAEP